MRNSCHRRAKHLGIISPKEALLFSYTLVKKTEKSADSIDEDGIGAFVRSNSSVMLSLLSRKLGAISFSDFGNGRIDEKSGCSFLAGCATIKLVHNLESTSKGGSDG